MVPIKELSNLVTIYDLIYIYIYIYKVYDWMIEINHETIYKQGQNLSGKFQILCKIPSYGKFLISIFQQLFASIDKIFIQKQEWGLGYNSMKVRDFPDLS